MALGERSLGLCSTCNTGSICTRRKGIKLPVLLCEEFDDSTSQELEIRPAAAPESQEEETDIDPAMGLCCNCRNHDACTLQDSPGGVWHCEEYC